MNPTDKPPKIYNRPGLPTLAYRISDWASFRDRLLANLPRYANNITNNVPLAKLTTRAVDDPAIAILDAWAVVADVLTFYQERIANEGFIETATELRSVLELARAIGYELDPGVAASTYLAFTVDDAPGSLGMATVPAGTQIVSIPGEDELPQTFETSAEIIARVQWNLLKPRPTKPQEVNSDTKTLYLQSINTQLQAGDRILLIDNISQEKTWYLLTLATVETNAGMGYTQITWEQQLPSEISSPLQNPQVFAFRQRVALFGYNAPKWRDMPNEIKRDYQGTINGGIFRSSNSSNWTAINYQIQENYYIFAGTDDGIYHSSDNGESWELNKSDIQVHSLIIESIQDAQYIIAGTVNGILSSINHGDIWLEISSNPHITSLAYNSVSQYLLSGTKNGIFRHDKNQNTDTWTTVKINIGVDDLNITTIVSTDDNFFVGSTFDGFVEDAQQEWPNFQISSQEIDLDNIYPKILPKSWIVLLTEDGKSAKPCLVESSLNVTRRDFGLNNKITQVISENSVNPSDFNLRQTIVLAQSEILNLADETLSIQVQQQKIFNDPIRENQIHLNEYVSGLEPDKTIIVSGKRIRAKMEKAGILISPDGLSCVKLKIGDLLQLLSPPKSQIWNLRDRNGFEGFVEVFPPEDNISLQPAAIDDEIVSEVCIIKTPPNDQLQPILTLTKALQNSYDPETVVIYANVTPATHGETIEEVLGSGDGTLTNQTFILNKPPLTYIPATTPSGAKTTLELFVDGVRWQEVPSLYGLNHLDQNYITRIDDDGTTTITFGDGEKGARLPSGLENIMARYRSGIGLAGEIAQDSLSLLKTRPLGIREVTNPVSATGAAAREALNEARTSAPLTVRTLDRIVSLQDFEDFSRAFAGIGKAKAEVIPNQSIPIIYITIGAVNGKAVTPDSQLYTNLVQAIAQSRAPEQIDVQIGSYQPLLFNLEAKILIDSRREVKPVLAEIRTALQETFSFENRDFGQSVTISEAIAAIQNITGVIAVDLDALYLSSLPKTLESSLSAATATWDEQQSKILPAQLLLLNPKNIILINTP